MNYYPLFNIIKTSITYVSSGTPDKIVINSNSII